MNTSTALDEAPIVAREKALLAQGSVKLVNHFGHVGECNDPDGFHSYPSDGACKCGMYRHHVHCTCGGITQVG